MQKWLTSHIVYGTIKKPHMQGSFKLVSNMMIFGITPYHSEIEKEAGTL